MTISLKKHSISQIEETIATALSNLCEEPVEVTISSFIDTKSFIPRWKISIAAEIYKKEISDKNLPF